MTVFRHVKSRPLTAFVQIPCIRQGNCCPFFRLDGFAGFCEKTIHSVDQYANRICTVPVVENAVANPTPISLARTILPCIMRRLV